jgi:ornithine decarboxylase
MYHYSIALAALFSIVQDFVTRFPKRGAFYAMVPSRVNAAISLWRTQLPAVKPFYAVKCNPDPIFLNTLFDANINFDCASERELRAIRDLARNTLPNRVVYANPCKSERDLVAAKEMGSPMTVVDSVEEVEKLSAAHYSGGALVRVAVDDTDSLMPFSSKFGAPESQVEKIIVAAAGRRLPLHGISFHVGSGSGSADAVSRAMMQVSKFYSMFPIY